MQSRLVEMTPLCRLLAVLLIAGCSSSSSDDGSNSPPYPVIKGWIAAAPGETDGAVTKAPGFKKIGSPQYYQLKIQEVGGQKDPDGDQVFFRSSALPDWTLVLGSMTLDADTGVVTLTNVNLADSPLTIDFWSEDANGADTSATPYTVTFTFTGS